ncbi:hypothetical protein A2U01_0016289, partial [Trifolium medium]|nr:hypothetical protein [Trifolium medium]
MNDLGTTSLKSVPRNSTLKVNKWSVRGSNSGEAFPSSFESEGGVVASVRYSSNNLVKEGDTPECSFGHVIWKLQDPERVRCFAWKVAHGHLPTNKMISKWG